MKKFFVSIFLVLSLAGFSQAQTSRAAGFQGKWLHVIYAESKNDLPPIYKDKNIREIPEYFLILTLTRKGNKLFGKCEAGWRFGARAESSDITAVIKGNTARFKLESGWGGNPTVAITRRGKNLYWRILKSEGEHYFLDKVTLRRIFKEPKFSF